VLLRNRASGPEVLLLRRSERVAFAPGMWVFPGGVVDPLDSSPEVLARIDGLTDREAAEHLGLVGASPSAHAYYVCAFREVFEETGLTPACNRMVGSVQETAVVLDTRAELVDGLISFSEALRKRLDMRISAPDLLYIARWITPEHLERRYDTRFFLTEVSWDAEAVIDPRESTEAVWVRPENALLAHAAGFLPMMPPTLHTLKRLEGCKTVLHAWDRLSHEPIPTIMPPA